MWSISSATVLWNTSHGVKVCSRSDNPGRSAAAIWLRPSRSARKRSKGGEDRGDLVVGVVLAVREDRDHTTAGPHDPRGLGERGDWILHELEYPDEERRVGTVVGQRQLVDVGDPGPCTDPLDRDAQHRLAQVEADRMDVVSAKAPGDDPGTDTEFDDRGADDPWCQRAGKHFAAPLAAARCVVDRCNPIERGARHPTSVGHSN